MLAPSRQMLSVKQVDEDSGELRNVGIDDDSALLGVVGLEADSKIYLKVRPYVHRPKEGKPPWCGDFSSRSMASHGPSMEFASQRRSIVAKSGRRRPGEFARHAAASTAIGIATDAVTSVPDRDAPLDLVHEVPP